VLGVPPQLYAIAGLVVLIYQFWIHTEHIGKLGWFDRWFSSPSNHRVHHATNPRFVDRNYGAILVLWDRLFGTFQEEDEPCVYGTLKPLNSWSPLDSLLQVYRALAVQLRQAGHWRQGVRVLLEAAAPLPSDMDASKQKGTSKKALAPPYNPEVSPRQRCMAVLLFLLLSAEAVQLLWQEEQLVWGQRAAAAVLIFLATRWRAAFNPAGPGRRRRLPTVLSATAVTALVGTRES